MRDHLNVGSVGATQRVIISLLDPLGYNTQGLAKSLDLCVRWGRSKHGFNKVIIIPNLSTILEVTL